MINQYAGVCAACHGRVQAGEGRRVNDDGAWKTFHPDCVPVRKAPPPGTHEGWHTGPMVAFDVETTLPEPLDARMVQAALIPSEAPASTWLINPGVPIPADATARHHLTDDHVRENGVSPAQALRELGRAVDDHIAAGTPLVAFYASFDMTVLRSELARNDLPDVDWKRARIIDPFILHRRAEPRWWGKRTLGDLCAYYEVRLDNAHDAASDATATLALARAIGARHANLATMSLDDLHAAQVRWFAEDSEGLRRYYERKGIQKAVNTEWPLETTRSRA